MYWAIKFSEETKNKILKLLENCQIEIPSDWKVYCDHITLVHQASVDQKTWEMVDTILHNFENDMAYFRITGFARNAKVMAVSVSAGTLNKVSHITIAVAPGHKPVESNDLENWEKVWHAYAYGGRVNLIK